MTPKPHKPTQMKPSQKIGYSLKNAQYARLVELAKRERRSISQITAILIEEGLDRRKA